MRKKNTKKTDAVIIVVLLLICAVIGFSVMKQNNKGNTDTVKDSATTQTDSTKPLSYTDYAGKKLGVKTGTLFDGMTQKHIPNAEISYFNNYTDLVGALLTDKIDAFAVDEPVAKCMMSEDPRISYIKDYMEEYGFGYAFPKTNEGKEVCDKFSEYIKKIKSDGTLQEIDDIWFGNDKAKKTIPPLNELSAENGILKCATEVANDPFVYILNGQTVGYDIDVAYRFCKEYGYGLEIIDMNFGAIIPAVQSGKCDFGFAGMTINEERAKSVYFTEPNYEGGAVIAVRAADIAGMDNGIKSNAETVKWQDYNGKKIGILTASAFEDATLKNFPDSKYLYYNTYSDLNMALSSGMIDGYIGDEPVHKAIHNEQPQIDYIKNVIQEDNYSFGFPKNNENSQKLCKEFNEFLAKAKSEGVMDELDEVWFGTDEEKKVIDFSETEKNPEKLKIAICSSVTPFTYIKDGKYVGYAMDLAVRFCKAYGYSLDIEDVDIPGLIVGVTSGKYDMGVSALSITPERAKSMLFGDPFYYGGLTLAVRSSDLKDISSLKTTEAEGNVDFFTGIKNSFEKNFIHEARWKLIVDGIITTLVITLFSTIFGTLLAFLICLFRRTESKLAILLSDIYVRVLQGTPAVVLLMILYYIVFGKSGVNAVVVAVVGFSLNLAAYVSEMMRSGIESIDPGQREAALALGFTEKQAFYKFIFPQAASRFLPVYRGEIISLLKNTSIVGYIAVQDLTKMSDIIRSRTYEAFFPLIATALIYFILAWFISLILSFIEKRTDPKKKRRQ
ncbi:MAG: ABC transporter permease subunit [Firmicutes bacterium]|nr:ABC transporter permease subunit [Bacillota bacterium]